MSTTVDEIPCAALARPQSAAQPQSALPYAWMLLAALAFTCMGGFARSLAQSCPWLLIAAVRTLLAMAIAGTCALASGQRLVFLRPGTLWMRSLAGSVSLLCTFYALGHADVKLADVYTLTNTFPIWIALFSWPLLGAAPSRETWAAIAVGTIGVALIQRPYFDQGNLAALMAMLSAISTAVAMIGLHRLGGVGPWAIVAHFSGVSFVCCLIGMALTRVSIDWHAATTPGTLAMFVGMGVSAALGQVLLTKSFAAGAPAKVSVVSLSQVAMVMALESVLWPERKFDLATVLGIALVLTPTAWLILKRDSAKAYAA